jgi:hypothetical protein
MIKKIYNKINYEKKLNYNIIKNENVNSNILYKLHYIDNRVIEDIKQKIKYSYTINYKNNQIIINQKNENISKKLINDILNVINNINNLTNNNKSFNIILYLSDLKKRFPNKKNEIIGPNNVNSGVTIHYNNGNNGSIILYRKEELIKVLIHELLHSVGCDESLFKSNYNEIFYKIYNIESKDYININESYIEINALIIFLIYKIKKENGNIKDFNKYLKEECKYSLSKFYEIMDYYDIQNLKGIKPFKQNSNVFSYYIIKTGLLIQIKLFYKFMENINNFKLENINNDNYVKLILKTTNELNENLKKIKIRNCYIMRNSLRMSINNI